MGTIYNKAKMDISEYYEKIVKECAVTQTMYENRRA